jgi:hypothetical protein
MAVPFIIVGGFANSEITPQKKRRIALPKKRLEALP